MAVIDVPTLDQANLTMQYWRISARLLKQSTAQQSGLFSEYLTFKAFKAQVLFKHVTIRRVLGFQPIHPPRIFSRIIAEIGNKSH